MKFDKKYISTRFTVIFVVVCIISIYIFGTMCKVMFFEAEEWREVGKVTESDSIVLPPSRGNILSADGQLLASSLPNYKLYIDFRSGVEKVDSGKGSWPAKKDTVLNYLDSISSGLAEICPIMTPQEYYNYLKKGLDRGSRHYELCPGMTLNYIQYNKILELPFFNKGSMKQNKDKILANYKNGLVAEPRNNRKKPFGSLAKRTLGEMYGAKDSARSGLELAYDSVLRGKPGLMHQKKVLSKFLKLIDLPAMDGYDLVTSLDVNMQDICEHALREEMNLLNAEVGVVILMEVKTGDVKAIVNLQRYADGNLYESRNYALASLMEPGSTFKTASMMVAMDDGFVHVTDGVDTGCGIVPMYGAKMKDHNWNRGGYGYIDVPMIMMKSSNIGVAKLIDKNYHNKPEKFVEGLRRIGIGTPLHLPFVGAADPQIRYPAKDRSNWPNTTLPWMAIGYETQIPPISTVTFYNAIANGGKMVRPRFVKGLSRNGEMVEEYPVEVIKPQICKESTLKQIQKILQMVVCDKEGLGRPAGNPEFHVSGKTGTAQISASGKYGTEHLVSFCGYFPSEDPKYTCMVAIRHNYYVASGGGQAGPVFSKVSQQVLSKHVTRDLVCLPDSGVIFAPNVKNGSTKATQRAMQSLGVRTFHENLGDWCSSSINDKSVTLSNRTVYEKSVPNVMGMGARDAVYALESKGLKVVVNGRGKVCRQSITAGSAINKGQTIELTLN